MGMKTPAGENGSIPRHISIIMDGNGRWAQRRGLPRSAGHKAGAETFRRIARYCKDLGVEYLTVYAFSTENWKRPAEEVGTIMGLLEKYLLDSIAEMEEDRIRLRFFGDLSALSPRLQELIARTAEIAGRLPGCFQANVCLNYGGRDEIVRAARALAESGEEWSEENLERHLDSAGIPDPELIIRPGGEYRVSNFLLWQSAYAEYVFSPKLWPDFQTEDIDDAIARYRTRDRRFGGVQT
ncbi:MAG: polyprenyl diphosphate synthase [Oscillospiraceae bacterium]|nr:polyprenyl diphosphate synthase [Oscillospiraceae bacterium]